MFVHPLRGFHDLGILLSQGSMRLIKKLARRSCAAFAELPEVSSEGLAFSVGVPTSVPNRRRRGFKSAE